MFYHHPLVRMDEDLDVSLGNVQIQPYQFEPLASGHDSVKNSSESDSASEDGDINIERIGQVDW